MFRARVYDSTRAQMIDVDRGAHPEVVAPAQELARYRPVGHPHKAHRRANAAPAAQHAAVAARARHGAAAEAAHKGAPVLGGRVAHVRVARHHDVGSDKVAAGGHAAGKELAARRCRCAARADVGRTQSAVRAEATAAQHTAAGGHSARRRDIDDGQRARYEGGGCGDGAVAADAAGTNDNTQRRDSARGCDLVDGQRAGGRDVRRGQNTRCGDARGSDH